MRETQVFTRYKIWADQRVLSTLSELPEAELTAPREIIFGSLLRTLNHAYQMDHVWKCHLQGKPHGLTTRNPEGCPTFKELIAAQSSINGWYYHYTDTITEDELEQVVDFEFIGGEVGHMKRGDILLHVVNHATYHRGHIAGILYQLNISPPVTDFPVFLRETFNDA